MRKRPLLFLLLKIKGNKKKSNFYFVFVLSPVRPTFDLKTKIKVFFAGFRTTLFMMVVTVFISLIRALVANEILKWVGCVRRRGRGGGGGSPRNCRWGCKVPFFKW